MLITFAVFAISWYSGKYNINNTIQKWLNGEIRENYIHENDFLVASQKFNPVYLDVSALCTC